MQEIFILRHAHAEDLSETQSKVDFDRKLTPEGIEKAKKLSEFFNTLEVKLDIVLSSPYLRAKETAAHFIGSLEDGNKPEIKLVDFLSSGVSVNEIAKGLLPYFSMDKIALVGHAPDLELFLGKLIGAGMAKIKLKKGSIAKVILSNSLELSGELEWLITPKVLKRLKIKKKATSTAAKAE